MEFHDKIILHPTDFSDNAAEALRAAVDLLPIPGSRLLVLHVLEPSTQKEPQTADERESDQKERLTVAAQKMEDYLTHGFRGQQVNPVLEKMIEPSEHGYKGILDVVNRLDPFLVVVGRKGNTAVKNALLGSTTKHLVEKSRCQVLVVPPGRE